MTPMPPDTIDVTDAQHLIDGLAVTGWALVRLEEVYERRPHVYYRAIVRHVPTGGLGYVDAYRARWESQIRAGYLDQVDDLPVIPVVERTVAEYVTVREGE